MMLMEIEDQTPSGVKWKRSNMKMFCIPTNHAELAENELRGGWEREIDVRHLGYAMGDQLALYVIPIQRLCLDYDFGQSLDRELYEADPNANFVGAMMGCQAEIVQIADYEPARLFMQTNLSAFVRHLVLRGANCPF